MRLTAGIAIATLLCIGGSLAFYSRESEFQERNRDQFLISAQERTYAPLAAMLPADAEVGYLSDAEPGSAAASSLFLSAQYLLAPRLLVNSPDRPWVIGNFGRPGDFAAMGRARGLRLERDFGDGLILYRKER
jgi:hypothetical protein